MSSEEEQFTAAVKVINNLPKNGSYTPSNEMMLKFYSFYKQATEGPCSPPRPPFWEPVKKAKWDAWSSLGQMSKEVAMDNYVSELKKIIETMSFSEPVAEFMDVLGPFYERVEVKTGLKFDSLKNESKSKSNEDLLNGVNGVESDIEEACVNANGTNDVEQLVNAAEQISHSEDSDVDEYSDSVDQIDSKQKNNDRHSGSDDASDLVNSSDVYETKPSLYISQLLLNDQIAAVKKRTLDRNTLPPVSNGNIKELRGGGSANKDSSHNANEMTRVVEQSAPIMPDSSSEVNSRNAFVPSRSSEGAGGSGGGGGGGGGMQRNFGDGSSRDVDVQVALALQQDLRDILIRVRSIESLLVRHCNETCSQIDNSSVSWIRRSKWWPFPSSWPIHSIAVLFIWPFVMQWIAILIKNRYRKR